MFVDKNAYLTRIGYQGDTKPTLENLIALHRHQAFGIPFDNFDVRLRGDVSLDKEYIFDKLVYQGRGGYCYEMNGLFADALQYFGYQVQYLTSRPMLGYFEKRPKTHMILKVDIEGESYICDHGFTGMSLIEPLKLEDGVEAEQYGFAFKMLTVGDDLYQLQSKQGGNWVSLFEFDLQEQLYIDFTVPNFFNVSSPDSICTRKIIASIYTPNGRIHMLDNVLRYRGGDEDKDVEISSAQHLGEILQGTYKISLTAEELDKLYDAMTA